MGKFLIRSEQKVYTIENGSLKVVNVSEISAATFAEYGFDGVPGGNVLVPLLDPEVLYWQNEEEGRLPIIYADVLGTSPAPQVVVTEPYDMSDRSIIGIESITADASEDVLFAISFDDGASWKAYEGNAWGTLDQPDSGMSKDQMTEISVDAWAQVQTSNRYRLRIVLTTPQSYFAGALVTYLNP